MFAAGKWELVESDKFDDYMKAVGVGLITRKVACTLKPTQEVKVEGNNWNIVTASTFKTSEQAFTVGVPFKETTADGRDCETTASLEGQKLTLVQNGDVTSTIIRNYDADNMTMTLSANDITCTRKYKRSV